MKLSDLFPWSFLVRDGRAILHQLSRIETKVEQLMASEQQLSDDLDKIQTGVTSALSSIADLKAQIAVLQGQAGPVSQAQLDDLTARADAIVASLSPATPPPAA